MDWEPLATLLLLDSFAPKNRLIMLNQALQHVMQHDTAVWILRYDQSSAWATNDIKNLRELKARMVAHYAKWYSKPSRPDPWRVQTGAMTCITMKVIV